jgi:hypothetical protein
MPSKKVVLPRAGGGYSLDEDGVVSRTAVYDVGRGF